jgi:hypothetical protein
MIFITAKYIIFTNDLAAKIFVIYSNITTGKTLIQVTTPSLEGFL